MEAGIWFRGSRKGDQHEPGKSTNSICHTFIVFLASRKYYGISSSLLLMPGNLHCIKLFFTSIILSYSQFPISKEDSQKRYYILWLMKKYNDKVIKLVPQTEPKPWSADPLPKSLILPLMDVPYYILEHSPNLLFTYPKQFSHLWVLFLSINWFSTNDNQCSAPNNEY